MSDKNIIYDCEYIKSVTDEYFHGELTEDDKKAVDSHLLECSGCTMFYYEEKKLTDIIKSSEYIPEISFSNLVMEKIINEKITIQKPRRKRPIPFGLISAAVIVLLIFAANPNMFNTVDKASNESAEALPEMQRFAAPDVLDNDSVIEPYYSYDDNAENEISYGMEDIEDMVAMEDILMGAEAPMVEAAPAPPVAAPFAVAAESDAGSRMYQDIPIPTGQFCECGCTAALLICVSVDVDIKEKLINELLEQIKTAETDEHNVNIIYMSKEEQEAVKTILDKNGIPYEIRPFNTDSSIDDIAVFFY